MGGGDGLLLKRDVNVITLPGSAEADLAAIKAALDTMQADMVLIKADVGTAQADIALIKAQNRTAKATSHSFVFDEDDTVKTAAVAYNGMVKNLYLIVPAFANVVTATVTLVDADGRIIWTSAAKAKGASYNLTLEAEWFDQLVDNTLTWTITLSGAAGGAGGTVVLVPRYYGV